MTDTWTPDFTGVHANTPIYPRGEYELEITNIRGSAYIRERDGATVKVVYLRPKMVGMYDSKGKLSPNGQDGSKIEGEDVEEIRFYLHSEGAMKMTKRQMMAILGYQRKEEDKFNKWASSADLSFKVEETEDGNLSVTLGKGWQELVGKRVRASLDVELYEPDGREPEEQQQFASLQPVG